MQLHPKLPTLIDFDQWLRARVRAKASVADLKRPTNRPDKKPTFRQGGPSFRKEFTEVSTLVKKNVKERNPKERAPKLQSQRVSLKTESRQVSPICCVCEQVHDILEFPNFIAKTVDERAQFAKSKNRCFKCLTSTDHMAR